MVEVDVAPRLDAGRRRGSATSCPGTVFVPFHYGYWDDPGRPRAANELTLTEWDPVSKQPHFKYAAVRLAKVTLATRAADLAGAVSEGVGSAATAVRSVDPVRARPRAGPTSPITSAIAEKSEDHLAEAFEAVAEHHGHEPDVLQMCRLLASWSRRTARPWARSSNGTARPGRASRTPSTGPSSTARGAAGSASSATCTTSGCSRRR